MLSAPFDRRTELSLISDTMVRIEPSIFPAESRMLPFADELTCTVRSPAAARDIRSIAAAGSPPSCRTMLRATMTPTTETTVRISSEISA